MVNEKSRLSLKKLLVGTLLLLFILFYPMLISIYVFLPLFIGFMGYLMITGIERRSVVAVVLALLYFINLNVNLSLPFFLITLSVIFVYTFFYPYIAKLKKCTLCIAVLSVILIDFSYAGALMLYDFIFQSESIVFNEVLLYSLIIDLLFVVVLF